MFNLNRIHGGIQIPKNKERTKDKPIEKASPSQMVYLPVQMHIGNPASIDLGPGDRVKIGILLAQAEGPISANIHSSVSGKVIEIKEMETFRGRVETIVIENDFEDQEETLDPLDQNSSIDDFVERLREAGITGKGGAGFTTAVKYAEDADKMNFLLVNGAECEPYSTTDHRIMVQYSHQILKTMDFIAIEDHMEEAIDKLVDLRDDLGYDHIYIHELGSAYPQGHSGLQVREVLGIEIEEDQRTGDVGVLQSNVSTIKAIHDAVFEGRSRSYVSTRKN